MEIYIKNIIPESRREINEPIREDLIVLPDEQFSEVRSKVYNTGYLIGLGYRLLQGGVIDVRLDTPCIHIYHEKEEGLNTLMSSIGIENQS